VTRSDVYNPATNSWTRIADMPTRLTHAGVATVGRDVYFAGGYIGTGPGYTQQFGTEQVWRYNVDTNTYHAMPNLPAKLAGGGLVAVGRNLHYFGGNNASRQDVGVHYRLNLDNPAAGWVARKSMITARSHMGYVNLNGRIYAVGGQKGNDGSLVAQSVVEMYDPATDTWTSRRAMPRGVNHISGSTFVMGGRILTLGGQTSHNTAIADTYAYDPVANTWTSLTPLPSARFSGVAATINGKILFTGGSSQTTTWSGTVS
jgi:N-acetylneuraminic acid mutarotase